MLKGHLKTSTFFFFLNDFREIDHSENSPLKSSMLIYMKSRTMVQMNLFTRQEQRGRCREWTCGQGREGEGGTN